jgi:high-affinity K+ transport system ATPase subunit B
MAAKNRIDPTIVRTDDGRGVSDEPQMRDLLKQLAGEGTDLVRNEISLAKLEMREMAREVALDSAKLAASLGLALIGVLALLAAAIIGLGNVLDGRYALSALIIGVIMVAIGGVLASAGIKGLKNVPQPDATKRSLQRDKEWASREAREFKEGIRS